MSPHLKHHDCPSRASLQACFASQIGYSIFGGKVPVNVENVMPGADSDDQKQASDQPEVAAKGVTD